MEERACSAADTETMKKQLARNKTSLLGAAGLGLVLSFVLPFLPPKYKNGKGVLDMLSYPDAVVGILFVFGLVFAWYYYYSIHRLKKDIKYGMKISTLTTVSKKRAGRYRSRKYYYFNAPGLPHILRNIPVSEDDYNSINPGDNILVEYSKRTKMLLGIKKI